jgi:hypothetical protein
MVNMAGGPCLTLVLSLQESTARQIAAASTADSATARAREVFEIIGAIRWL